MNQGPWEYERHCAAIEAESTRFVEVITDVDPRTPVPTCPGWTIAALVKHHGTTQRWIDHLVQNRVREPLSPRDMELDLPTDEAAYPAWLAAGAEALLASLRGIDPDAPIWSWGADQNARFWSRRMLHETVIHRADAELACGQTPHIDVATAADGIDEFLAILPFWLGRRGRELRRDGATVHLHATDSAGEWMVTLHAEGPRWERGHGKGTAAVRGATGDLLQLTYGRCRPDDERFTVFGDRDLLTEWLTTTAF
ncbi:MAG TPA: maleylpyruvate isomerase family mycothiol-dependent enzyme [Streptosporangiaceae bacterium]|jgi:uncharacterized protein (TIGR03083 family)